MKAIVVILVMLIFSIFWIRRVLKNSDYQRGSKNIIIALIIFILITFSIVSIIWEVAGLPPELIELIK